MYPVYDPNEEDIRRRRRKAKRKAERQRMEERAKQKAEAKRLKQQQVVDYNSKTIAKLQNELDNNNWWDPDLQTHTIEKIKQALEDQKQQPSYFDKSIYRSYLKELYIIEAMGAYFLALQAMKRGNLDEQRKYSLDLLAMFSYFKDAIDTDHPGLSDRDTYLIHMCIILIRLVVNLWSQYRQKYNTETQKIKYLLPFRLETGPRLLEVPPPKTFEKRAGPVYAEEDEDLNAKQVALAEKRTRNTVLNMTMVEGWVGQDLYPHAYFKIPYYTQLTRYVDPRDNKYLGRVIYIRELAKKYKELVEYSLGTTKKKRDYLWMTFPLLHRQTLWAREQKLNLAEFI